MPHETADLEMCTRKTCLWHEANMQAFKQFSEHLDAFNETIHKLDIDIVQINSAARVRMIVVGIAVTIGISVLGYINNDGEKSKTTIHKRISDLQETVDEGMRLRYQLQGDVKALKDRVDLLDIKKR